MFWYWAVGYTFTTCTWSFPLLMWCYNLLHCILECHKNVASLFCFHCLWVILINRTWLGQWNSLSALARFTFNNYGLCIFDVWFSQLYCWRFKFSVIQRHWVSDFWHFRGSECPTMLAELNPEDDGSVILWNIRNHLLIDTLSHPTRHEPPICVCHYTLQLQKFVYQSCGRNIWWYNYKTSIFLFFAWLFVYASHNSLVDYSSIT
jgi:hypothetical protein